MSTSTRSECGGRKRNLSLHEDEDFFSYENYENNHNDDNDYDTPEINSVDLMERIDTNVTATHQIKLLFRNTMKESRKQLKPLFSISFI